MLIKVTEAQIFEIEESKVFGSYTVKRVNNSDFDVIENRKIVFKGEDYEIAEFLNSQY
ncbi:hypothetical protein P9D51_24015 [Bacillus sonorensis]|uniref:hypothetical protein n=1 Tax=Bacillus sonorensis TaxID=119858 RepID=UPI002DBF8E13|nr:hypothetical protein [Bacillus sonorensis]MEC1429112.1 hypothetical protein [Bacillus sonorensis]